jgi:hypothetical protein
MAITTENTYLIYKDSSSSTAKWAKLVDIKEFPDLGSTPGTVEVTTLSDHAKRYLLGLKDTGVFEFTANYDKTDYGTVVALEGKTGVSYGVQFGKKGENGVFTFDGGGISVTVKGGGTEAAVDMSIAIAVDSEPTLDSTASVTIS